MIFRKNITVCLFAAVSLFLTGCHAPSTASFQINKWQPIYRGIDYTSGKSTENLLQQVYAIRVDLTNPDVEFISTPDNGCNPLMTDGQRTSEFLKTYHCNVAFNANPFSPVDQTRPRNLDGLAISNGQIVSKPNIGKPSLLIMKDNHARITDTNENTDLRDVWTAVSGFNIILSNGTNIGDSKTIHPRTAVGISQNNRFLFIMVIDGRQPHYSEGATLYETAEWLQRFGAYNGLNLDGGGSTTLVRSDNNIGAIILNRPINNNEPGNERINGNNLGIIVTGEK